MLRVPMVPFADHTRRGVALRWVWDHQAFSRSLLTQPSHAPRPTSLSREAPSSSHALALPTAEVDGQLPPGGVSARATGGDSQGRRTIVPGEGGCREVGMERALLGVGSGGGIRVCGLQWYRGSGGCNRVAVVLPSREGQGSPAYPAAPRRPAFPASSHRHQSQAGGASQLLPAARQGAVPGSTPATHPAHPSYPGSPRRVRDQARSASAASASVRRTAPGTPSLCSQTRQVSAGICPTTVDGLRGKRA